MEQQQQQLQARKMTEKEKIVNNLTRTIEDSVNSSIDRLEEEGLVISPNYAYSNALKSATFELSKPDKNGRTLLEKCDRSSVANALLKMVIQGLSPAKQQCYFIARGKTLVLERSYFGTMKVIKGLSNVKDIWAEIIYEGDVFEVENVRGRKKFVKHETNWQNQDNKIIGAYCIIETNDGEEDLTVMTRKEIDVAWTQAQTKAIQNKYPQEMTKRTVINRAAKKFINTSDDSDLVVQAIKETTENEYDNDVVKDVTPEEPKGDLISSIQAKKHSELSAPEETAEVLEGEPLEKTNTSEEDEAVESDETTEDNSDVFTEASDDIQVVFEEGEEDEEEGDEF